MTPTILTDLYALLGAHNLSEPDEVDIITARTAAGFEDIGVAVTVARHDDRQAWLDHLAPDGDVSRRTERVGVLGCDVWLIPADLGLVQMRSPLVVVGDVLGAVGGAA